MKKLMFLLGITAMSVEVYAGEVKLGSCSKPPFHINDFYRYDVIPPSKTSAHITESGPARVLQIGPSTC